MPSRDSLHRLIDNLPESEITRAERLLEVLTETAEPLYTLENARKTMSLSRREGGEFLPSASGFNLRLAEPSAGPRVDRLYQHA